MYHEKSSTNRPFYILVVDDVETNLKLLGLILQEQNYDISVASCGKDALSILETEQPDLILLDIMMPEMDGFEVCKRVKANPKTKDIPIIFLTARTEIDDIVKGFEIGAVDYVTKPFNTNELLARINTHLTLKRAKEELQELNNTISKFFSIIINDIKNHLVGVKGLSNFIVQDIEANDPQNSVKFAKILYSDSSKLYDLLENLVDWAIIQTDSIEHKPENIILHLLVEESLKSFSKQIENKKLNIHNIIAPETAVVSDRVMINAILYHLISNAVKYSKPGGEITINAQLVNDHIEVAVTDNGVGIEEERLKKLFKLDSDDIKTAGTADEAGSGLGLVICKSIVSKLGGKIWLESQRYKGTTAIFTIPCQ